MRPNIRIGGASAFLSDSAEGAPQLLRHGRVDYLVFDYLAEVTMSLLAGLRQRNPDDGYAKDFIRGVIRPLGREIQDRRVKVIANAGGVNPASCAAALRACLSEQGVNLKVAFVEGDDLLPRLAEFEAMGLVEMFTSERFPAAPLSVNAYLGAFPIAAALAQGADIVVTGRSVDSALTLGACIYEFGWEVDDYDKLAMGSLAGHIIECGAQACGALFTDWRKVGDFSEIGFPIAECTPSGDFIITKPEGTSGLVSRGTIAEQLLYEVSDPQSYFLPDVVCDFAEVALLECGPDQVAVRGARGYPPTCTYKTSVTYADGWRTGLYVTVNGMEAAAKARQTGGAALRKVERQRKARGFSAFNDISLEVIGDEDTYGPHRRPSRAREAVLKVAARHERPEALQLVLREFVALMTSGAPGTTGMVNYPPRVTQMVRHFSTLVAKEDVQVSIDSDGRRFPVTVPTGGGYYPGLVRRPFVASLEPSGEPMVDVPLVELAWARSGDKGLLSNIGVIARDPAWLPAIRAALTPSAVAGWMAHLMKDGERAEVLRFDVPGFSALNFVLPDALGGGGVASLRNDPLGKAYAQMLLEFPVPVPQACLGQIRNQGGTG
jgi:hypothetical protein